MIIIDLGEILNSERKNGQNRAQHFSGVFTALPVRLSTNSIIKQVFTLIGKAYSISIDPFLLSVD